MLGAIILFFSVVLFKGCILTKIEFGDSRYSFNWHYLNKLGVKVSLKTVKLFTNYLIPAFLLIFAFIWQEVLTKTGH